MPQLITTLKSEGNIVYEENRGMQTWTKRIVIVSCPENLSSRINAHSYSIDEKPLRPFSNNGKVVQNKTSLL